MLDNSQTDEKMDRVYKNGKMDRNTMVSGLITICMVRENGHSLMDKRKKVYGKGETEPDGLMMHKTNCSLEDHSLKVER